MQIPTFEMVSMLILDALICLKMVILLANICSVLKSDLKIIFRASFWVDFVFDCFQRVSRIKYNQLDLLFEILTMFDTVPCIGFYVTLILSYKNDYQQLIHAIHQIIHEIKYPKYVTTFKNCSEFTENLGGGKKGIQLRSRRKFKLKMLMVIIVFELQDVGYR